MMLLNFNETQDLSNWNVVSDTVMGGVSNSNFSLNDTGFGVFTGKVSLENNGGFSMVRCHLERKDVSKFNTFSLRIKGDGKTYQFRVKTDKEDTHSYVLRFNTSGAWETIEIPFDNLKPTFRGKDLDMNNYPGNYIAEVAFLIGNKKEETFCLEIESVELL
ncbi:CIA30 family protein [Siansivirga zeaxanthinifaciens]|uniref:NADH:ubiquinone oxidoreductase n=1 Tax=Siansivirga zeaxanthinifaciens CC-SAMT-1 TaxID=1454006 RepID=A0A0C5W804_9FLAO|nr:CIA30 family protein [Siansivirga zeaxanthinifaciens]AJR02377.1 NADH:ubiquinone oxidoreductase [Siansivirga zeaxanthinifaciens CC-SAMT-1]